MSESPGDEGGSSHEDEVLERIEAWRRRRPKLKDDYINSAHGAGGKASAALIDEMTADRVSVTLVNIDQLEPRTVVVQGGAYAEHQFTSVKVGDKVIMNSGIYGTISIVRDKEPKFQLKIADNPAVKIDISQSSIAGLQEAPEEKK